MRSIYTRQKVTGLADLQGLTIRVQESDMMSEMITDLGAKPVKVVYSKVYAALHNGEIDGAENNWPSYEAMGHYEETSPGTSCIRCCGGSDAETQQEEDK